MAVNAPGNGTSPRKRIAAGLLALWLLASPTGLVFAGPVADAAAPGNQRPTVTTAPTGVPMVNIAAPNASGLSYNRYQRFDVDPIGLLLNNSRLPVTAPLGVDMPGNPNFAGRSANLIVNEVVTAIPSNLNGPLGVLGDPAKVVIANPNGIACNGCSFLNTPQVTLTTGSVAFKDASGATSSFDAAAGITLQVGGGRILIDGSGLSSPLARLDLVSETIRINGPVTVTGALNLLAGRQTVDADSLAILATGAGNDAAGIGGTWAIDATVFGALNAGSIRIVATPAGMGVRSSSQLAASGTDLVIDANGDLTLANATAARDIDLTASGATTNSSQIVAGRNVSLAAASLDNGNSLIDAQGGDLVLDVAGVLGNTSGSIAAHGAIDITAGSVANGGGALIAYGGNLRLTSGGLLDNRDGLVSAQGNTTVTSASLNNTGGRIQAIGDLGLTLTAGDLDLSGAAAGTLAANGSLAVRAVNLANSGSFGHAGLLTLTADSAFTNTGNLGGNALVLNAGGQFRNDGSLYADTRLALTANSLLNRGAVVGNGTGSFKLASALNNRATGRLDFTGPLDVVAGTLGNAGSIITQGAADFRIGTLTNDGTLAAGGTLGVTAAGVLANHGTLAGGATTAVGAASLINTGTIESDTDLGITAATVANSNSIKAVGHLTLAALGGFTNSGTLVAGSDATIDLGSSVDNTGGKIAAVNDLTLTTTAGGNLRGMVAAGRDLTLDFTDYTNGAGETDFVMGRDLIVTARNLDNAGLLAGYRNLRIATTGNLANRGQLAAGQDATLDVAGSFTNFGIVETGRDLTISAASVSNGTGGSTTQSFGPSLSMADYRNWVLTTIDDPVIQGKLFNEITPDWQWHNSRFYLIDRYGYFRDSDLSDPQFSLTLTRAAGGATLNAGRNFTATVSGAMSNNTSTIQAGGDISITAASFENLAAQDTYEGNVFAGGGGHTLKAYGNSSSVVHAGVVVSIVAPSISDTGNIVGNQVYLGGSLVNGLTSYTQPTPATTLPHAVIDLSGAPVGSSPGTIPQPAGSSFTPLAPTLFSSAAQLALLAPVGQSYLTNLLPANLRSGTAFLMDAWLEQQALRQAALGETGQAIFVAGLAYDNRGLSIDSQQRILLYQAAAKFATDNGIKLGVALSEAQQKALTSPILWYVEQSVIGPDGKTYQALVPKVYLPEGQLADMANIAGGIIRGHEVTIDAKGGRVENTGYIAANNLTVNAAEIVNRQRSASWGSYTQTVKGGYLEISGDRVQPGGFMSAAQMNLHASRIDSISGIFLEAGKDKTAQLQQQLGGNFSQSQNIDHTFVKFHEDSGAGLGQVAVMAIAIAVAYVTAGAASGMIASTAGESAAAAAAAAGATAEAAAAAGTAAATAAASSVSTAMISGAVGSMASTATTGLLTGNFDMGNVLKSGLSGGLTAGLTSAPLFDGQSFNQLAGIKDLAGTGTRLASGDFSNFGQNLLGMAGRSAVNAGVNSALYGTSFGNGFKQSLVADLAAAGANAVGGKTDPLSVGNIVGHAAVGAFAASLLGRDAVAGAIGGAGAAIINPVLDNAVGGENGGDWGSDLASALKNQNIALSTASMLGAGFAAEALGRNGTVAANTALNETQNNYLTRENIIAKYQRLQQAETADAQYKVVRVYAKTSNRNTNQANAALGQTVTAGVELQDQKQGLQTLLIDPNCSNACRRDALNSIAEIDQLLDREGARSRQELLGLVAGAVLSVVGAGEVLAGRLLAPGLRTSTIVSTNRAEEFLIRNGMSLDRAIDFVSSFDGPITARVIRPGESFLRYTDIANSSGSFVTKTIFVNPATAVDGLYLAPYGNGASFMQSVTATGRSIVLEGGIANGGAGIRQSIIVDRSAFQFGTGVKY